MKQMRFRQVLAAVLAAAMLAGCGGSAASSGSSAGGVPKPSGDALLTAENSRQPAERIREQLSVEKVVGSGGEYAEQVSIHLPELECDSADAAAINEELRQCYAEPNAYYIEAQGLESWNQLQPGVVIDWDAYWYGDCVSIVVNSCYSSMEPTHYKGWCFDFATGQQLSVSQMLTQMGLDPDAVQTQVYRKTMQALDRNMAESEFYDSLRVSGMLSDMRQETLYWNGLEYLPVMLQENTVTLRAGYRTTGGRVWYDLNVDIPLTGLVPENTPVLTDTYGSASVQLKGDSRTVTIRRTPETIEWEEYYGIHLDGDVTLPIQNAYGNYVDVCIGELGASFHPVVYLLTEDGFVEYVDVLRCLSYGQNLVCGDPIYIANHGTALKRNGGEVELCRADGSTVELAPLTAEWNGQDISSAAGSYDLGEGENWCWMDLESSGSCQIGVRNNRYRYEGSVSYLGAVPEGVVLGFSLMRDTADGPEWTAFTAAMRYDGTTDSLILTPMGGQNPFAEGESPLTLTRSYG